jgi:hypothetical protein
MPRHLSLLLTCAALALAPVWAAGSVRYRFQQFGDDQANAINNVGQVVGIGHYGPAWYFDGVREIDMPDVTDLLVNELTAINNSGVAVGSFSPLSTLGVRPLRFDGRNASEIHVPGAQQNDNIRALDINDAGDVLLDVESLTNSSSTISIHHPVLLTASGQRIDIPLLPGLTSMIGYAVNNNRVVIGGPGDDQGTPGPAFRFQDGQTNELAPLSATLKQATAVDINDAGVAVGYGVTTDGTRITLLFRDGQAINLSERLGQDVSASAINTHDQIVGSVSNSPALIDGDTVVNLETSVSNPDWVMEFATDINDRGQIVGAATSRIPSPDEFHSIDTGFVLTPTQGPAAIPLPAAAGPGLALLALVGSMTALRRNKCCVL